MLKWVFGRKDKAPKGAEVPDYETAKNIAASGSAADRQELASQQNLQPEFLYYFATDKAPEVRRTVAKNPGTPLQADAILANDTDDEVRCELAEKIGKLLPELSHEDNQKATDMVHQMLDVLARDQLPRVRAIIASEIKNLDNVPKPIVSMLARDVEEIVAAPVLQFSPLLEDADLVGLISGGLKSAGLSAIAKRDGLTERVSEAVVGTGDEGAVGALLGNQTAAISETSFDSIATMARDVESWHAPLSGRQDLPGATVLKVARFLSASLLRRLAERNDLDPETSRELEQAMESRIAETGQELDPDIQADEEARARAETLIRKGGMTAALLTRSLDDGDLRFVTQALSLLSDLPPVMVRKIFNTQSAKSVVALTWKSGFDMDLALSLQRRAAKIEPKQIIQPEADGAFPYTDQNMEWQLELLAG